MKLGSEFYMTIDIICPLYNAEEYILDLHESLKKQKKVHVKNIIYVLTESKDNTEKVLKENKINYKKIQKEEFSHSLTREKEAMNSNAHNTVPIIDNTKPAVAIPVGFFFLAITPNTIPTIPSINPNTCNAKKLIIEIDGGQHNEDKNIMTNPVKRLFYELGIKHRKIKPYRPQTNGKIERFWRTIDDDFVDGTIFTSQEELEEELFKYMIYYNEYRPHQGINGLKPIEMLKQVQKISTNSEL